VPPSVTAPQRASRAPDAAGPHGAVLGRWRRDLRAAGSGGWTLHQLRHSRLTHLAESGVQLPIIMSKSRHTSLASLAIYVKPTFDAVATATAALDPERRRR
jgi:integrase